MTTEDEPRLTSLFEASLDLFIAASGNKSLITEIKMAKATNDSFKLDNRKFFYMQASCSCSLIAKKKMSKIPKKRLISNQ